MTPNEPTSTRPLGRRTVLQGSALTGVAAVLAACGTGTDSSTPPAAGGQDSGTPSDTAPGSPAPGTASAAPLAQAKDIPVGGGLIVDKVVITQPEKGTFKAFSAICTHAGCTVSDVAADVISCPCHGSTFSGTDGAVINGPATSPLAEVPVEVTGGQVLPA